MALRKQRSRCKDVWHYDKDDQDGFVLNFISDQIGKSDLTKKLYLFNFNMHTSNLTYNQEYIKTR